MLPPQPAKRFHAAMAAGDVRSAWGALGSSGWSNEEMRAAWRRLAPLVDPTLKRLVDAKVSDDGFPAHEGY